MKNGFVKITTLVVLLFSASAITFYACSKSSGYGNNGGNNGGTGGDNISIKNFAFSAATLTVATGTTVKWTNNDGTTHTVTADDGSFDSGDIAPGASFSHKFTTTGTVGYHCYYHPMMKASVAVSY